MPKGRRIGVSLHQNLAPYLAAEAIRQRRSISNLVSFLVEDYLTQQGYKITSSEVAEWEVRHKQYETRAKYDKTYGPGQSDTVEGQTDTHVNGRSDHDERAEDAVPNVERHS